MFRLAHIGQIVLERPDGTCKGRQERESRAGQSEEECPVLAKKRHSTHLLTPERVRAHTKRVMANSSNQRRWGFGLRVGCFTSVALASTMMTGVAAADGLVLASSAGAFRAGDRIATEAHLKLAPGERLSVLDRSGDIVEITASGIYAELAQGQGFEARLPALTPVSAAFRPGSRPDIGGTRSNLAECLEAAATGGDVTEEDCRMAHPEIAPQLTVETLIPADGVTGGAPLSLKFTTNFDAMMSCTGLDRDDGPTDWIHMHKDVVLMMPSRGMRGWVAPEEAGVYDISCEALDLQSWRTFARARSTDTIEPSEIGMVQTYAELRESPVAATSLTLVVIEK